MYQPSNHTSLDGAASLLVAALEHTWQTIRSRHPDVADAVLMVASGAEGRRLNLGHFAPHRWQVHGADRHEVLVGGEGLQRGPTDVLGTLLHEAAHGLAQARSIQDTSRDGRYHNRRYATLACELGLEVAQVRPIGWSATTVPNHTAAAYAAQLEELAAALVLWRRLEHRSGAGTRARNLLVASCGCGRRIRVAKTTLAEAPIVCGACEEPFQPADPDEASNLRLIIKGEPGMHLDLHLTDHTELRAYSRLDHTGRPFAEITWDFHGPPPDSRGTSELWGTTAAMRRLAELILQAARLAEEEACWQAHTARTVTTQGSRVA
jgi:hypothetical protein